ncbi:hypothetical protein Taro_042710, partial [Colocasia esculenta]|nr:hypothetical protein [Colocasia esculenta]
MLQTQDKIMQNWSSSVDTRSSSVDTRDSFQKTFWPIWDSVSTLDQVVSTLETLLENFWANLGQCVDTRSSSVDTRDLPRTPFGLIWDSVSTLDQRSSLGHPLTLSEWFVLHHQALWGPFILKEIRIAKYFQLYNDFRYLNKQGEVQFGQFHAAVVSLRTENPINCSFTVDFTTLKMLEIIFLPKLHSVVLDSSAGSHAFERFARVMDWEKHYNQSALQLEALNSSLFRSSKSRLSAEAFLDLNSINPVRELYHQWVERYSTFISLKKDLKDHQFFYPVTIDQFLQRASFGKSSYYKFTLDKANYKLFLEDQRQHYIQRLVPDMGASFTLEAAIFHQLFEDQEIGAWEIISRHASLLSPNVYLHVPPQNQ